MTPQATGHEPGGSLVPTGGVPYLHRKLGKGLLGVCILLVTGIAAGPMESQLQSNIQQRPLELQNLEEGAGQGLVLAILGGFRTLVADILWLRTMYTWEEENLEKTHSLIQFTTTVDPRPKFFWINGARIIANDMPHWEDAQEDTPAKTRWKTISLARSAIELLEKAQAHHADKPDMILEIGHININRLRDMETAARYYLHAYTEYETAPYYIARLYAQLLRRMGRNREAYEYLKRLHPTLPDGVIYAQKSVVLRRIRILEKTLGIPSKNAYQPKPIQTP